MSPDVVAGAAQREVVVMGFWIGVAVVLAVVAGLAGLASWRRRGRSSRDLLPDARRDLTENVLRQRAHDSHTGP